MAARARLGKQRLAHSQHSAGALDDKTEFKRKINNFIQIALVYFAKCQRRDTKSQSKLQRRASQKPRDSRRVPLPKAHPPSRAPSQL